MLYTELWLPEFLCSRSNPQDLRLDLRSSKCNAVKTRPFGRALTRGDGGPVSSRDLGTKSHRQGTVSHEPRRKQPC